MASSPKFRPNSKFRDRLEVQDRFRINLESIIRKYDKPFEDSPLLDLEKMSMTELESMKNFHQFGMTVLATDMTKGRRRKGGVSTDSAIGSTHSPNKSEIPSSEDGDRDLYLQQLDFTHENSDALGAFVRYKHNSRNGRPAITGFENGGESFSSNSEDDLDSVCSGPTQAAREPRSCEDGIEAEDVDALNSGGENKEFELTGQSPPGYGKTTGGKVTQWLRRDSSAASGVCDEAGDLSRMRKGEQRAELSSELDTEIEEPVYRQCDKATSLLELRDRFVRKVHSILVEGNNETDDLSSSDDELDQFTPRRMGTGRSGQASMSDMENQDQGQTGLEASSGNVFEEGRTHSKSTQDPLLSKSAYNEGDTILAGHFDENPVQSPGNRGVVKNAVVNQTKEKCFDLVQTPGGEVEWTVHDNTDQTGRCRNIRSTHIQSSKDLPQGSSCLAAVTPQKSSCSAEDLHVLSARPIQSHHLRNEIKPAQTQCKPKKNNIPTPGSSKEIVANIVDFFNSPLPQLLNSPMPLLSPRVKLRTTHGKRIREASFKEKDVRMGCSTGGDFPSSVAPCLPHSPKRIHGSHSNTHQGTSSESKRSPCIYTDTSQMANDSSADDTEPMLISDNSFDNSREYNFVQRPNGKKKSISCTEDEGDNVSLLDEDYSDGPMASDSHSESRCAEISKGAKTPSRTHNSTRNLLVKVSKTPLITSPLGHLKISSDRKSIAKPAAMKPERKIERQSSVGTSRGLVFGGEGCDLKESNSHSSDSVDALILSSLDEENDEQNVTGETNKSKHREIKVVLTDFQNGKTHLSQRHLRDERKKGVGANLSTSSERGNLCSAKSSMSSMRGNHTREEPDTGNRDEWKRNTTPGTESHSRSKCQRPDRGELTEDQRKINSDTFLVVPGENAARIQSRRTSSSDRHVTSDRLKKQDKSKTVEHLGTREIPVNTKCQRITNVGQKKEMTSSEILSPRTLKHRQMISVQVKPKTFPSTQTDGSDSTAVRTMVVHSQSRRQDDGHPINTCSKVARKTSSHVSPFKTKDEHRLSVKKDGQSTRERPSTPVRVMDSRSPAKKKKGGHLYSHTSHPRPQEHADAGRGDTERAKPRLASHGGLPSPKVPDRNRPPVTMSPRLIARSRAKDVSFLSSTRLDEDPCVIDHISASSVLVDSGEEKAIGGTLTTHRCTPSKMTSRRQNLSSPSRVRSKLKEAIPSRSHDADENAATKKNLTPKRRRQGSDRANSLESPAKRRTPDGAGILQDSPWTCRMSTNRAVSSRVYDSDSSSDSDGYGETSDSRLSLSSSSVASSAQDATMETSSMCEGSERCNKTICFKCVMKDA